MLSNIEVYQFSGTNSELCEALGIQPSTDSPAHFYNYTARSVRAKAAAAIAAGKSDEPFELKAARTAKATATATKATATAMLPSELMALLPAMSLKLGIADLKVFIKDNASPDKTGESNLPGSIVEFLEFFGFREDRTDFSIGETSSLKELLLRWAGVPTRRDYVAAKLSAAIGTLSAESNAKFDGWTVEKMQSLLETLTAFALLSDSKGN